MKNRLIITALMTYSAVSAVFATNFEGAWKGPKELMVNLCIDGQKQPYVCHCGIFRTYGWMNFSTTVSGDSLIMVSTDVGSPFEGRFRIESDDRLSGTLIMGNPDDPWYYDGYAEQSEPGT